MTQQFDAIETRTQELAGTLLDTAATYRPGAAERVEDWLLTNVVADEAFRGRLLRYLDVLASLDYDESGREAKRLAGEYFTGEFPALPAPLRWLLRIARDEHLPASIVGETTERAAKLFAQRFITPPGEDAVRATLAYLEADGRWPSFDLLGEAVLSDQEATSYVERYLALIAQLAREPAAHRRTAGDIAALQVSLKLSSLTHRFTPVDPDGSIRRARPALELIAHAARAAGIGITIDMEQYELRDLTWATFRRTFARGESLGDWRDAGIVVQGYLRDAEVHAAEVVAFARERGTPFQVRLVKGAYWDYETIMASANRWPPPVHTAKADTDVQYERLLDILIGGWPHLRLAAGSHNMRAHAAAEARREGTGQPPGTVEHQTLFRTAEGTARGLSRMGWAARDYVPVGDLLPGMAYLVRRVLENSSQAGFLLQSRSGASREALLRAPVAIDEPSTVASEDASFVRTPEARWFDAAFRADFEAALASTRARWGDTFHLTVGGAPLAGTMVEVHSPSEPDGPAIGRVELADTAVAEHTAAVARASSLAWAAMPAEDRAAILDRAADLLVARGHEFAAWIVHEGGRDRDGAWGEVVEAADFLRCYAREAVRLDAAEGAHIAPRGVVAVIPPWNFSLSIPAGMTVAALAMGNSVILKPARQTPLIAMRLVALLHEAGVPRDVIIGLPGNGDEVGAALVTSPDVAMVAFTGSRAVGVAMHEAVAQVRSHDGVVKGLVAEMGGKNPILVFADADLDEAVTGIIHSAFGHANQKCSAASRVLVAAPVYARLRDRLVEAARSLMVGRADDPATEINPVIDAGAMARLVKAAAVAREECTVLLDRFDPPTGTQELGPLLVELPIERALIARTAMDELFGPILVLIPFEDEAVAYRVANGTGYGLTSGVFSRSPHTIERASRALEAGHVYVNRATTGARVGIEPFGGMHFSGTGPKVGQGAYLRAFTRRTDAPADAAALEAGPPLPTGALEGLASRWNAPLETRLAMLEAAALRLDARGERTLAADLIGVAEAARRDLAPAITRGVAGQHTEMWRDIPRGLGVVHAHGEHAGWWVGAALAAGNAACVVASPRLLAAIEALLAAGTPPDIVRYVEGGGAALLDAARVPDVTFVATDAGGRLACDLWEALGPTPPGTRSLKALLSPLDGLQPGEEGFLSRFAWEKVVAVHTLRHGADLALEVTADREPR